MRSPLARSKTPRCRAGRVREPRPVGGEREAVHLVRCIEARDRARRFAFTDEARGLAALRVDDVEGLLGRVGETPAVGSPSERRPEPAPATSIRPRSAPSRASCGRARTLLCARPRVVQAPNGPWLARMCWTPSSGSIGAAPVTPSDQFGGGAGALTVGPFACATATGFLATAALASGRSERPVVTAVRSRLPRRSAGAAE